MDIARADQRPEGRTGQRLTFVLIPGAGGAAWYWHRVAELLREAGHEAIPVDLPGDDPAAGLAQYANLVVDAIGSRASVVLVAQSLGGFTAPLVSSTVSVQSLIFVNAMIPRPGETPGAWWDNTGWAQARIAAAGQRGYPAEFDLATYFLHDVPREIEAAGEPHQRPEADAVFQSVCDFTLAVGSHPRRGRCRRPVLPGRLAASPSAGTAGRRGRRAARRTLDRASTARAADEVPA